jgi:hypothetical protein
MSVPVYAIPETGLFLRADGRLLPKLPPGQVAAELTEAVAASLVPAATGLEVRTLSDGRPGFGDYFGDAYGFSERQRRFGRSAVEFLEMFVLVGDVVELGHKIALWAGLNVEPTNPLIALLEEIDGGFRRLKDTVLAGWHSLRNDNVAFLRSHASVALVSAQEYMEEGRPDTPLWIHRIGQADTLSRLAVHTFLDGGVQGSYWTRPYSAEAIQANPGTTHNSWMWALPDRAELLEGDLVWDYRWGLPAAMYAISARVAVLRAVNPSFPLGARSGCREISRYVRFLERALAKMKDGIRLRNWVSPEDEADYEKALGGRLPVAAADIYSGVNVFARPWRHEWGIESFAQGLWAPGLVTNPDLPQAKENVRLLADHWWWRVWRTIGAPELMAYIDGLKELCRLSGATGSLRDAQRLDGAPRFEGMARHAALAAGALSTLSEYQGLSVGPPTSQDAARTFHVFEALRQGEAQTSQLTRRYVEELAEIGRARSRRPPSAGCGCSDQSG